MTSLPGIPFDPTEKGPLDVAREAKFAFGRFVRENAKILIPTVAALFVAAWYFGISVPTLPNWLLVMIFVGILAAPYGLFLGIGLAKGLHQDDVEILALVDPATGDIRLKKVDPDRFAAMRVVNHNGKQRDLDFLHRIRVNGVLAYEVDSYDVEANVATASWQAGESNASIRRQKSQIAWIKTSLEREADKALELIANHPDILRQHATEVANRLVKVTEGIEVPQGGELHDNLSSIIEEADPSDDLLGDTGREDVVDEDDDEDGEGDEQDIFERAAAIGAASAQGAEHGSSEVSADD